MSGVNKVIIVGRLGKEPESKALPSGGQVVNLSIATSEKWKDKQTGEQKEKTEWHRIVVFNRLAEICAQWLKKGSNIYIEGSLRTRKWKDNSGADRYSTEIVASEMQMLDAKQQAQQPQQRQQQAPQQQGGFAADNFDEDIPF